ncbi:MAG: hypothetical protein LUI04_03540 [Porphyromonadaceae bacterium]|nr:hypothetical protein [Porphyromonadaceae bacterium]
MKKYISLWVTGIIALSGMNMRAEEININEDKGMSVSVGADVVSSYIWRGARQTGASIQPYLSFDVCGLSIGAWGSTTFSGLIDAPKEFDLSLTYSIKGITVGATDYWWTGEGHPYFSAWGKKEGATGNCHYFEGSVGYDFGELSFPLSVTWNTIFYGSDKNKDYSTYIGLDYAFGIKGVDCSVGMGITPWSGMYDDSFNVTDVSVKAAKSFTLFKNFETTLWVQAIFSPVSDDAFLVFGLSF